MHSLLLCLWIVTCPLPPAAPSGELPPTDDVAAAATAPQSEVGDAAGALVTDRPDATESAETVAPGLFQLETGYTLARIDGVDGHSLGEVLLRIGVGDDVELRAGFNSYEWARGPGVSADGLSDTSIGLKWQLAEAGPAGSGQPAVAVLVGTSLPTGADAIGDSAAQPGILLAAGLDLSDRVSVGANVGWNSLHDGELDERFSEIVGSLAVGFGLSDRWGAYAEYFGAYGLQDREDENYLNGGLTYLIHDDLQLDGRIGHGLNGRDDDLFLGFGAAVRW